MAFKAAAKEAASAAVSGLDEAMACAMSLGGGGGISPFDGPSLSTGSGVALHPAWGAAGRGRWIVALAAKDGDATLLGEERLARQQAGEQDEGGSNGLHARNRRQGVAASQWQVAHLAGAEGEA